MMTKITKAEAQQRTDLIKAFNQELARLEHEAVISLTDAQRQAMLDEVPLARAATASEIAAAVVYLASDEAGYITGHALRVNGGMYM